MKTFALLIVNLVGWICFIVALNLLYIDIGLIIKGTLYNQGNFSHYLIKALIESAFLSFWWYMSVICMRDDSRRP